LAFACAAGGCSTFSGFTAGSAFAVIAAAFAFTTGTAVATLAAVAAITAFAGTATCTTLAVE
jgi:hypothetical protein